MIVTQTAVAKLKYSTKANGSVRGFDMPSVKITGIFPKRANLIDQRKLKREVNIALDRTGNLIRGDFRKTTRTWSARSKAEASFGKIGPKFFGKEFGIEVNTKSRIYFFLARGTKSHFVAPRRAKALRFQAGYNAKTRPRIIGSRGGGAFGPVRFSKGHTVSGIKARDFDKEIAKRRQVTLNKLLRAAFLRASRS